MESEYRTLIEKISTEVLNILKNNNFKKTNWKEAGEIDPSFGGSLKSVTDILSLEKLDLIIGEFKKGERLKKHYHKEPTEEVYYILEGEVEVNVGDKKVTIRKGELLSVPPGIIHWPVNNREEICRILFILSPKEKENPVVVE